MAICRNVIKSVLNKLHCNHNFTEIHSQNYYDSSGFYVIKKIYLCKQCGKKRVKRFW